MVKQKLEVSKIPDILEKFLHKFKREKEPVKISICARIMKFDDHGTIRNPNSKTSDRETHSGCKKVQNKAAIQRVSEDVKRSPKKILQKRAQFLDLTCLTLLRISMDDLGKSPYLIKTKYMLTADYEASRWMNKGFSPFFVSFDEANFHLDGQVNSKDNVFRVNYLLQRLP